MAAVLFVVWVVAMVCIRERREFYAFMLGSMLVLSWDTWASHKRTQRRQQLVGLSVAAAVVLFVSRRRAHPL